MQGELERIAAGEKVTATNERLQAEAGAKRKRRLSLLLPPCLVLAAAVALLIWKWPPPPKAELKIMAVLPIDTLGQDPDTNALALGLTETLTAKLVQASDSDFTQVVAARDLRDKGVKTAEDARREFGTNMVLESSLQRSGKTVRINCSLVDSKTHRELAAKTIEADASDAFGLQDKIVSAALDMLPTQINPEQRNQLAARPDTKPAAYEAYVRGRGYLQEYEKPENIDNAIAEFNQALKIDPNYAPAYAGLGEAYWIGYQQPMNRGNEWLSKASQNCTKALTLQPQLADGLTCLGNVSYGTGKYQDAVKQYRQALDLNHDSDEALEGLASAYSKLGDTKSAEATFKEAIALRPSYWGAYSWLGEFYYDGGRLQEAIEAFQKAIELAPDNYRSYYNLAAIYVLQGQYQKAIEASNRSIQLRPNFQGYLNLGAAYFLQHRFQDAAAASQGSLQLDVHDGLTWGNLGDALYWSGKRSEAKTAYRKAIALYQEKLKVNSRDSSALSYIAEYSVMVGDSKVALESLQRALHLDPDNPDVMFKAALVYNHLGDKEESLLWLKKAAQAGYPRTIIRDIPDFQALREDPRFSCFNKKLK